MLRVLRASVPRSDCSEPVRVCSLLRCFACLTPPPGRLLSHCVRLVERLVSCERFRP